MTEPGRGSLQTQLVEFLETGWKEPDDGIWEVRGPAPALHPLQGHGLGGGRPGRAARSRSGRTSTGPLDEWRTLRDEIHDRGVRQGLQPRSRRLHPVLRVRPARRQRAHDPAGRLPARRTTRGCVSTIEAVERELIDDGFVLRYRTSDDGAVDGLTGRGGRLPGLLVLAGRLPAHDRARPTTPEELFERLLALRNDLGLLSEEYDPVAGRLVGNFPQAFSHVSLVNSAAKMMGEEKPSADHIIAGAGPSVADQGIEQLGQASSEWGLGPVHGVQAGPERGGGHHHRRGSLLQAAGPRRRAGCHPPPTPSRRTGQRGGESRRPRTPAPGHQGPGQVPGGPAKAKGSRATTRAATKRAAATRAAARKPQDGSHRRLPRSPRPRRRRPRGHDQEGPKQGGWCQEGRRKRARAKKATARPGRPRRPPPPGFASP